MRCCGLVAVTDTRELRNLSDMLDLLSISMVKNHEAPVVIRKVRLFRLNALEWIKRGYKEYPTYPWSDLYWATPAKKHCGRKSYTVSSSWPAQI